MTTKAVRISNTGVEKKVLNVIVSHIDATEIEFKTGTKEPQSRRNNVLPKEIQNITDKLRIIESKFTGASHGTHTA